MRTRGIIEGLTILQQYRDTDTGFETGADHDVIYAYPTDQAVPREDVQRLIELGWTQPDVDTGDDEVEFAAEHYDQCESWWASL